MGLAAGAIPARMLTRESGSGRKNTYKTDYECTCICVYIYIYIHTDTETAAVMAE